MRKAASAGRGGEDEDLGTVVERMTEQAMADRGTINDGTHCMHVCLCACMHARARDYLCVCVCEHVWCSALSALLRGHFPSLCQALPP